MANPPSGAVAWDFDGTLTDRDTTRMLALALLKQRPWRAAALLIALAGSLGSHAQARKAAVLRALCRGLEGAALEAVARTFRAEVQKHLRPALVERLQGMLEAGVPVVIATASPAFAIRWIFPDDRILFLGMTFEMAEGRFTGRLTNPVPYGAEKGRQLRALMFEQGWDHLEEAYSDTESDAPMLELAERGYLVSREGDLSPWPAGFKAPSDGSGI